MHPPRKLGIFLMTSTLAVLTASASHAGPGAAMRTGATEQASSRPLVLARGGVRLDRLRQEEMDARRRAFEGVR